jgi:hypothetical protein
MSQPPFDFSYQDYLTAQSDTPDVVFGQKAIHALGYFDQARIQNVVEQMELLCP